MGNMIQIEPIRIDLIEHIDEVLEMLISAPFDLSIKDAVFIMSHLDGRWTHDTNRLTHNFCMSDEYSIQFKSDFVIYQLKSSLFDVYYCSNVSLIKQYIKHKLTTHLPDSKKMDHGQYYTPEVIVSLAKNTIAPLMHNDTVILDPACGAGAFLDLYNYGKYIGSDINPDIVETLRILGQEDIYNLNSLVSVSREKFGINPEDNLIIVSNPPWNDASSLYKRGQKSTNLVSLDEEFRSSDLGKSFMLAIAKLNPDHIILVHPLSYLIKKSNFLSLSKFANRYKLSTGVIFSSHVFPDLMSGMAFPVILAHYEPGDMDYDYITKFEFDVLNSPAKFKVSSFETIDGYIKKYPTKTSPTSIKRSDIGLYMFTVRDINSMKSSGNIQHFDSVDKLNYVTICLDELYKYAYLNMFKHFFPNHYLYGNLSPLVNSNKLEFDMEFRDLMVMGMFIKNKRVDVLDIDNANSILYTHGIWDKFLALSQPNNIYDEFIQSRNDKKAEEALLNKIRDYFERTYKKEA